MTDKTLACADYFRSHPGYHRILAALRQKFQRYGRATGTIRLQDASPEECEAARLLLGRPFSPPLQLQAAQIEAALQETRFQGVCLKAVLEAYFGEAIKTNRETRADLDSCVSALLEQTAAAVSGNTSHRWLQALAEDQGGSLFRREAARDPSGAAQSLLRACQCMDRLEEKTSEPLRLAVLSAGATGDPHALDSGTLCGKLFLQMLAFRQGRERAESTEQRDDLYYENGILCDSISSLVTQVGLILSVGAAEHPAYQLLRQQRELCTLSLASLSRLTGASSPSGRVYIVENEMVFAQLCDRAAEFHSPLLCTSGQPSVAALRLLDLLAASGTTLFYSGDFDGRGLSIAAQLSARYPHLLIPWHMAPQDYDRCRSAQPLSDTSLALLRGCSATALAATAQAVAQGGMAGYQELLLPQLAADLTEGLLP